MLDVGQCNDAYSAIRIALALADAFDTDVNSLPLSLILSWYEQKAVVILLTLLHLGIKNIRIGPTLPAFVTPAVLDVLVKTFGLTPITTAEEDLRGDSRARRRFCWAWRAWRIGPRSPAFRMREHAVGLQSDETWMVAPGCRDSVFFRWDRGMRHVETVQ